MIQTIVAKISNKGITDPTSVQAFRQDPPQQIASSPGRQAQDTQFGFRAARSTSQPIHIIRRLIERADATGQSLYSLYAILLDWEKAFDKIHPEALLTAFSRFGVPAHLAALIKNVYTSPQFTVATAGHKSTTEEAQAGIRQGCPFSPYLYPILHRMIMHDVGQ